VIVIIGILLAIAVPSYLGFKARAEKAAAQSNVRAAIPSMEAFFSDHNTYVGADDDTLRTNYDSGLSATLTTANLAVGGYCIQDTNGSATYHVSGPGGAITSGACT
jgi:type IV pilus assembly protein PilA